MWFRGDLVHCPNLGELNVLYDYILGVDQSGYIAYVAPATTAESLAIIHASKEPIILVPRGSFLLPTFCDLHLHAPQFLYQGTGLHLPLMEWLNEYAFRAEESLDANPILAEKVYRRLATRLIENGTGAVLLFGTIKTETNIILARVMQEAGLRAFVGKLSMDISSRATYVEQSAESSLHSARSFVDQCHNLCAHMPAHERLVEPVITPRFVPTCSDGLLEGLGKLAAEKTLRVQSHMAEAHDQMDWVRRERGADDVDIFARHGLLTPRTVQAHCTFLGAPALSDIARRGTAVAHCPLSNAYFSAQPFRLREALQRGVRVGLGTDIAGGYDVDIMGSMRQAVAVSRMREGARIMADTNEDGQVAEGARQVNLAVDWKEALYLATRGGALALGLPAGCGTFTVGAPFDAQFIRVFSETTGEGIGSLDFFDTDKNAAKRKTLAVDMIEKWWCLGDHRNREGMWVQGRKVSAP
ncbi:hypothetical protein POSPLADRAFT_1048336 [Postia placenta MAD-698-R-SB12]|uniref:Amidohydrolase-related domain-containing protein n=1 Tax=Postia placenta MAD-698-R-SB12 TaxID=670580 RepID=A0A1X6MU35_9APHY|nr:hypothetical protein POSPLADRAFT_1048336 [Postia placenta MAD-698-R-SB12]OSX59877.1 hypothetical protein POSPLADRAFT_1048336 [Postia placenta MAD-698-R-SB12]